MSLYDPLQEEEDSILGENDSAPAPASSIAGPQTQRDEIMKRIAQVRGGGGDATDQAAAAAPASGASYAMDPNDPALQYARQSAVTAGIGRGINALASGTGFKADNSGYDAMEKDGKDMADKSMTLQAQVQKAVADRALKKSLHDEDVEVRKGDNKRKDKATDAYIDRTKAIAGQSQNRLDTANIRAANTILNDKNAQLEARKLQAARSAQSLVDGIRNGDLTDSKNVAKQLTNMIATIEMGTPGGQGDRQAMGVDTLYGRLKGMLSFVDGSPNSTIPSKYLDQLESETHALGDRAASNYKNLTDGTLSGADLSGGSPDADTGKVYTLAKQRRDAILKGAGYDPESGQPLNRKEKSKASAGGGIINDANADEGDPEGDARRKRIAELKAKLGKH